MSRSQAWRLKDIVASAGNLVQMDAVLTYPGVETVGCTNRVCIIKQAYGNAVLKFLRARFHTG